MTDSRSIVGLAGIVGVTVLVVVFMIAGLGVYGFINSTRNEGVANETQLSMQYLSNQNNLSAFVSGFYEQVGLAKAQSETLNSVLVDAVKGRYEKGGYAVNSPLFNVIREAYPEASLQQLLKNWGKIQDYVSSGREGYRNVQDKLLDQLRSYDRWRETGLVKSFVIRTMLGFPSQRLEARIGDEVYRGEEARNRMYRIVLAGDAVKAYETGIMDPLQVNPKK